MLSLNSVLLSATHPPFCSVSRCLSGVPEAETRGAPLPLTAAAASLLPASRRVPGPVAGLHHTPLLLLPPTTCGLPTPFSTSFSPRRSRSCRHIHREGERSRDHLVARRSPRTRSRALQSENPQTAFSRSLGAWRATWSLSCTICQALLPRSLACVNQVRGRPFRARVGVFRREMLAVASLSLSRASFPGVYPLFKAVCGGRGAATSSAIRTRRGDELSACCLCV